MEQNEPSLKTRLVWSLPAGTSLTAKNAMPPLKPGLSFLHYFHDDWCPKLAGGACACDPDMELHEIVPEEPADGPMERER